MDTATAPATARLRRRIPIFVCRKCLKRADEGGPIRKALKKTLKRRGRDQAVKPRVIATACFGICPKRAVVAASAATLREGKVLVIAQAAAAEQAAAALLPDTSAQDASRERSLSIS